MKSKLLKSIRASFFGSKCTLQINKIIKYDVLNKKKNKRTKNINLLLLFWSCLLLKNEYLSVSD